MIDPNKPLSKRKQIHDIISNYHKFRNWIPQKRIRFQLFSETTIVSVNDLNNAMYTQFRERKQKRFFIYLLTPLSKVVRRVTDDKTRGPPELLLMS